MDATPVEQEPEVFESRQELDERRFLAKAKRFARRLPFVRHGVAMFHAFGDDATPAAAKAVIVGALAYFVLPADLLPDFIGGLGFTDDAAVVAAALKTIGNHLKPEHYQAADQTLGEDA